MFNKIFPFNNENVFTTSFFTNNKYSFIDSEKKIKVGTAFSGIGAFEESLKQLNIKHDNKFMIDNNKFAIKTYLSNHEVKNVYKDITTINPLKLDDIDIFVFGSPCQSFSSQGNRLGFEDTRGTLIFYGLEIIKVKQPKYFIFENVKGLINHDGGNTFEVIKNAFNELNYNIDYKILNAKHYGAAQNRERIFVIGIRKDIKQEIIFPKPQKVSLYINDLVIKGIDYSKYIFNYSNIEKVESNSDIKKIFIIPHLKFNIDRQIYSTYGISPCLLSGNTKAKFFDEKNKIFRYLTERELKLIQGFNNNFILPVSNTQARKQIGNSIFVGILNEINKLLIPQRYFQNIDVHDVMAA